VLHADVLGERARITPDRLAVVDVATGVRLTYHQLNERAAACARTWQESLGLKQGDRVALLAGNRVEFLDAFFAAAKSGIVLVPLSTRLTPPELRYILSDCEPRALLYDDAHAGVVRVNVSPAEIEGELLLHEAVADAAVVGIPDETWGEIGVAFLVVRPGRPIPSPDELSCFLERRLARYKLPNAYVTVESLPRTPYGKVVKGQLRDNYLATVRPPPPVVER
jgi:acyl-CoA synthetase (AMP-forming)/AMP-acid ligase II